MLEVRTCKLSDLRDMEKYLYSEVDSRRKEKAMRFVHSDDRLRSLAVGYMMKKCLPGYSEGLLYEGRDGKPLLRDGVPFSISHGGNFCVLAWCGKAQGIGVDVEPIRDMECYRSLSPFVFTSGERQAVGDDAAKAVRIWTRKESLYKCVGEGISDFRELPEVLEDSVLFFGKTCALISWEHERHSFSLAVRGLELEDSPKIHLKEIKIRNDSATCKFFPAKA